MDPLNLNLDHRTHRERGPSLNLNLDHRTRPRPQATGYRGGGEGG